VSLLIKGGRVVDPAAGVDAVQDVLIADGRVAQWGPRLAAPAGAQVMDASGKVVCPGFIDVLTQVRVHVDEIGRASCRERV